MWAERWKWQKENKNHEYKTNLPFRDLLSNSISWTDAYPVDLDVVQLLLPLQDVLHAVHPDVDVPHQDRFAHVLNKTTQRDVQSLQQFFDGTDVLLVIKDCRKIIN